MESGKGNARIARLDAFREQRPNSLLELGLRLLGRARERIESELAAVEEESQFGYFISGNSPFGNSAF